MLSDQRFCFPTLPVGSCLFPATRAPIRPHMNTVVHSNAGMLPWRVEVLDTTCEETSASPLFPRASPNCWARGSALRLHRTTSAG